MENAEELKKDLDTLQRWEQTSLMEFKLDKCEVSNISNERSHVHNNHNIHRKTLVMYPKLNILV